MGSFKADFDRHFGPDDFRIEAASRWQLDRAKLAISLDGKINTQATVSVESDKQKVRFARITEIGSGLAPAAVPDAIVLCIQYPETGTFKLHLQEMSPRTLKALTGGGKNLLAWPILSRSDFRVVAVDVQAKRVLLTTPIKPLPQLETRDRLRIQ